MFDAFWLDFRQIDIVHTQIGRNHPCQLKKSPRLEKLGAVENGLEEGKTVNLDYERVQNGQLKDPHFYKLQAANREETKRIPVIPLLASPDSKTSIPLPGFLLPRTRRNQISVHPAKIERSFPLLKPILVTVVF